MGNEISRSEVIGLRISKLRERQGWSQKQLMEKLAEVGLSVRRETVTQWENGTRELKSEYIIKLAEVFNVSCDYILRGVSAEQLSISEQTGLNEDAIKNLSRIVHLWRPEVPMQDAMNAVISDGCFPEFVDKMRRYTVESRIYKDNLNEFTGYVKNIEKYADMLKKTDAVSVAEYMRDTEKGNIRFLANGLLKQRKKVDYLLFQIARLALKMAENIDAARSEVTMTADVVAEQVTEESRAVRELIGIRPEVKENG